MKGTFFTASTTENAFNGKHQKQAQLWLKRKGNYLPSKFWGRSTTANHRACSGMSSFPKHRSFGAKTMESSRQTDKLAAVPGFVP